MKKIKILSFAIIFTLSLSLVFGISAFALTEKEYNADAEAPGSDLSAEENVTADVKAEDDTASTKTESPATTYDAENFDNNEARDSDEVDGGVFSGIVQALESYASEILSALAFIGSLIIMLTYKKGLMPVVNDGLRAIKNGVKTINERSESFNAHAISVCDGIDERLTRAETLADNILKSNEGIEKKLSALSSDEKERERLSVILASQIDMLYEIFMSAGLPQYLKDSVGERISEMKATLGKEAKNEALD